ncbi:MAG: hypothetical protein ACLUQ6_04450 [Alistipes onderdonkii]
MYSVSPELYHEAAARLSDAIDGRNYFRVRSRSAWRYGLPPHGVGHRLPRPPFAARGQHPVTDLVPVWWEFHTTQAGGEVLNDFDFSELKRCV